MHILYMHKMNDRVREKEGERASARENRNSFKHLYPAFQFIKVVRTFQLTRRFNEVYFLENYFTSQFEPVGFGGCTDCEATG